MLVDETKCIGCGRCIPFCPVQARSFGRAATTGRTVVVIDRDRCAECGVCERAGVCPVDAIHQDVLEWPRQVRSILSNPLVEFKGTGIPGRGTEEIKTNEVTGRVRIGRVGVGIEVGRPGVSTRWTEVDKICRAVAKLGIEFCADNPITHFMVDKKAGILDPAVVNEVSLSAIVEFEMAEEQLPELFRILREEVDGEINTVYTFEIAARLRPDGSTTVLKKIQDAGYEMLKVSKNNLGLGRPKFREEVAP
jgi:NAD-dependent dihydropyrimidine dehydrogenase PreA subunit